MHQKDLSQTENNTSMDLKLLVKQQPELKHYEHEYGMGAEREP